MTTPTLVVTLLNVTGVLCLSACYSRRVIHADRDPRFNTVFGVGIVALAVWVRAQIAFHSLFK